MLPQGPSKQGEVDDKHRYIQYIYIPSQRVEGRRVSRDRGVGGRRFPSNDFKQQGSARALITLAHLTVEHAGKHTNAREVSNSHARPRTHASPEEGDVLTGSISARSL